MLYLLDANVLIDAHRDYYPFDRVPEFWEWLAHSGGEGHVKIPLETHDEIKDGADDLGRWARDVAVKEALLLGEEAEVALVDRVAREGYAADLTDEELERVGRDPFLVAYALRAPHERCIVTTETSKPRRQRANRHLPDVCTDLGVQCCNTFEFLRALNFRTRWQS